MLPLRCETEKFVIFSPSKEIYFKIDDNEVEEIERYVLNEDRKKCCPTGSPLTLKTLTSQKILELCHKPLLHIKFRKSQIELYSDIHQAIVNRWEVIDHSHHEDKVQIDKLIQIPSEQRKSLQQVRKADDFFFWKADIIKYFETEELFDCDVFRSYEGGPYLFFSPEQDSPNPDMYMKRYPLLIHFFQQDLEFTRIIGTAEDTVVPYEARCRSGRWMLLPDAMQLVYDQITNNNRKDSLIIFRKNWPDTYEYGIAPCGSIYPHFVTLMPKETEQEEENRYYAKCVSNLL